MTSRGVIFTPVRSRWVIVRSSIETVTGWDHPLVLQDLAASKDRRVIVVLRAIEVRKVIAAFKAIAVSAASAAHKVSKDRAVIVACKAPKVRKVRAD